jgi:hypothetical protein
VLAEHGSAVGVDLAEGDGSHPGSFESEREAADTGEEVEDIQRRSPMSNEGLRAKRASKQEVHHSCRDHGACWKGLPQSLHLLVVTWR